jgi:hypothetical protein
MKPIEQAKSMFPNMPDELFNIFLSPFITDIGWPFLTVYDSIDGTDWYRLLSGLTLKQFSNLTWDRRVIFLNKSILHPLTQGDIDSCIFSCTYNTSRLDGGNPPEATRSVISGYKERIVATGCISTPIVAIFSEGVIRILDGIHRTTALFSISSHDKILVEAWIGE